MCSRKDTLCYFVHIIQIIIAKWKSWKLKLVFIILAQSAPLKTKDRLKTTANSMISFHRIKAQGCQTISSPSCILRSCWENRIFYASPTTLKGKFWPIIFLKLQNSCAFHWKIPSSNPDSLGEPPGLPNLVRQSTGPNVYHVKRRLVMCEWQLAAVSKAIL